MLFFLVDLGLFVDGCDLLCRLCGMCYPSHVRLIFTLIDSVHRLNQPEHTGRATTLGPRDSVTLECPKPDSQMIRHVQQ
jgi:hypothetical protein